MRACETLETDILVIGAGGAGLLAALHAHDARPDLETAVVVKGLMGKCGCTRMVQGGYNVVLNPADSVERHFMDTIEGGKWLNDQDLAWRLVNAAIARVHELENRWGCFFDRNPDGTIHQKAFAGQSFDRTVHKGSLTGIEIVNRLSEQVRRRPIRRYEEHRAVALIPSRDGGAIAGALVLDVRRGVLRLIRARAVLLATGGGPSMYRYQTPSGDKACDGLAMALRLGLTLRDMEMVQFHPTGLVLGPDTRVTGTIIEEGLRGVGGHLLNGQGERFMPEYDPRAERATRDIVSRSMFHEMRAGRVGPHGGLFITMRHLDPAIVRGGFKGMVDRCADVGFDLVGGLVEVTPTAHYMMGGVIFHPDARTDLPGLYAAGEDTGGVHGANRLGGNGVANSTVFGGIAGDSIAADLDGLGTTPEPDAEVLGEALRRVEAPFAHPPGDVGALRDRLQDLMWADVGILRDATGLRRAQAELADLAAEVESLGVAGGREFNHTWQDRLDLENQILVGRAIAASALARTDSRGAHFRLDHPECGDLETSFNTRVTYREGKIVPDTRPVRFTRVRPGGTLQAENPRP